MSRFTIAYVRALGLRGAGAMRTLAATVAETEPAVLAVCEIDPGDAFALATRFAREWAYRGGQALFWTHAFAADGVRDRGGRLRVHGRLGDTPATLYAMQFAAARATGVPELRDARTEMRRDAADAIAFAQLPSARPGLGVRGVALLASDEEAGIYAYARGFAAEEVERRPYSLIVAAASHGMPPPQ